MLSKNYTLLFIFYTYKSYNLSKVCTDSGVPKYTQAVIRPEEGEGRMKKYVPIPIGGKVVPVYLKIF